MFKVRSGKLKNSLEKKLGKKKRETEGEEISLPIKVKKSLSEHISFHFIWSRINSYSCLLPLTPTPSPYQQQKT